MNQELEALKAENAQLKELTTHLKGLLTLKGLLNISASHMPLRWELTYSEATIMSALLTGRVITRAYMKELLYWDREEPENADKALDVFLHNIRRKVGRDGIQLINEYGIGYHLDPCGKQIVMRYM